MATPIYDQLVLESYQQDPEGRALADAILTRKQAAVNAEWERRAAARATLAVWFGWVKP